MGFEVKCVPVLDRMFCCCCSCDLRIATCVLGWLDLIGTVGSFLRSVISFVMFPDPKDDLRKDFAEVFVIVMTVIAVSAAVCIIITSLLLYGAHSRKPGFMLPYVIFHMITTVIAAVAVVGISILLFFSNVLIGLIVLVVGGLCVGLSYFFWLVIYSYYRKLEEQEHPPPASSC